MSELIARLEANLLGFHVISPEIQGMVAETDFISGEFSAIDQDVGQKIDSTSSEARNKCRGEQKYFINNIS
uniref:t-SNARE coiled-coil homology domain-containing protein n=1 Tax=Loa loa TaxID=7209 RepID=A0A1I7V8Y8_LOALO